MVARLAPEELQIVPSFIISLPLARYALEWSFDAFMADDLKRNQLIGVRIPATPLL
mgnify:CR=1 FL=1